MRGERVIWRAIIKNRAFNVSHYSSSSSSIHSSISQQFGRLKHHMGLDLLDVWPSTTSSFQLPSNPHSFDGLGAEIIDGKSIAAIIKSQIAAEILRMKDAVGKIPGLAFVLVGQRNDSHCLVRTKMKACDKVGISSTVVELDADCTEGEALHVVSNLNEDPSVHGVNVQLPLPEHMDEEKVLNVVNPEKDVDGFHPLNMGCLATKGRKPF